MDWKRIADYFDPMTCVLSVEKKPDGKCGTVRIVTGNQKYIDSISLASGEVGLDSTKKVEFVPNSEYTRYIPKDLNFEDVCFRAAVLKQPVHNCVHAPRYDFDIMAYLMPLESNDENMGYCTFSQVLLPKNDNNLMSLNISQETAMEIIGTCIKLREDKPFGEIMQEVIENIREICGAEYCCVLLMDHNQRKCTVLGQAKSAESSLTKMEDYLDEDFYSLAETWMDTMSGSFCIVVRDRQDMDFIKERNPAWYQSLKAANVERLVLFPLISRGRLLGYIYASNFQEDDAGHIKDTLELTTYFIASEIANNQFIEQLQEMSKMDLLTGVMNRNAMNERITTMTDATGVVPAQLGVVFADMNGLKFINDHQGHEAGDLLLKNAAIILQNTFAGGEIYRAGGDEFFILVPGADEKELQAKIAEIKNRSRLFDNVSFAAGYCVVRAGMDPRKALSEADAMMYEDKENCYRENPELKRD